MTETLYLRAAVSGNAPSAGTKSAVLVDSGTGVGAEDLSMSRTHGTSVNVTGNQPAAGGGAEQTYLGRFTSPALLAQTIPAQTWTAALMLNEEFPGLNLFAAFSAYVWNPGGSSVRGYIYDSTARLGNEWHDGDGEFEGRVVTFAGASVAASASDVLVVEVWGSSTACSSSGVVDLAFDGVTVPTEGSTDFDAASYISCPNPLFFSGTDLIVSATAATATAAANVPAPKLTIPPGASTASALANVPTLRTALAPAAATATAAGNVPALSVALLPGVSTATALANVPALSVALAPAASTATAAANTPAVVVSIATSSASATAAGVTPTLSASVSPSAATATALAPTPGPTVYVSPASATATAQAFSPVLYIRIAPPAATATAYAPVPNFGVELIVSIITLGRASKKWEVGTVTLKWRHGKAATKYETGQASKRGRTGRADKRWHP